MSSPHLLMSYSFVNQLAFVVAFQVGRLDEYQLTYLAGLIHHPPSAFTLTLEHFYKVQDLRDELSEE